MARIAKRTKHVHSSAQLCILLDRIAYANIICYVWLKKNALSLPVTGTASCWKNTLRKTAATPSSSRLRFAQIYRKILNFVSVIVFISFSCLSKNFSELFSRVGRDWFCLQNVFGGSKKVRRSCGRFTSCALLYQLFRICTRI